MNGRQDQGSQKVDEEVTAATRQHFSTSASSSGFLTSESDNSNNVHYRIYWQPELAGGLTVHQMHLLISQIKGSGCSCTVFINPKTITSQENKLYVEQIRDITVTIQIVRESVIWAELIKLYRVYATGRVASKEIASVVDYLYLLNEASPDSSGISAQTKRVLLLANDLPGHTLDAMRYATQFGINQKVEYLQIQMSQQDDSCRLSKEQRQRQFEVKLLASTVKHMCLQGLNTTAIAQFVLAVSEQQISRLRSTEPKPNENAVVNANTQSHVVQTPLHVDRGEKSMQVNVHTTVDSASTRSFLV